MTCFWDGIMKSLNESDKILLNIKNDNNIYNLIDSLKNKNIDTVNIHWQHYKLIKSQLIENKEHIKSYNKSEAPSGYLCSTCDPFLILLSEILEKNIIHDYLGNNITYTNTKNKNGTIFYKSDKGHFWFINSN
jgi:hypothetical protein